MRLFLLFCFFLSAGLYAFGALRSYGEEARARDVRDVFAQNVPLHPEANLRIVRRAFEARDYSDALLPHLERALTQAPSYYQPAFLMAAFYANRVQEPEVVHRSFELALSRFPANGRLHLTYAEWLLTPRPSAPYRAYRTEVSDEEREHRRQRALQHVKTATGLEPDLTRQALAILIRFQVPPSRWAEHFPPGNLTGQLLLEALDRAPADQETRRNLLGELLTANGELALYRAIERYGRSWRELDHALEAAKAWRRAALVRGDAGELLAATTSLAGHQLDREDGDRAYAILRDTLKEMEERSFASEHAVELLTRVGDEYLKRGRAAMAQSLFTEAVTLSPYDVPAHLGLARTHRFAGDLESARFELERVLELEPSHAGARELLDRLLDETLSPARP